MSPVIAERLIELIFSDDYLADLAANYRIVLDENTFHFDVGKAVADDLQRGRAIHKCVLS